ncbi:hypothetical protein [Seleniivibrio woodruffii]|uniref:phosphoribosylanthranilate isomerase n=1 Tax=Seleniivibrio woodruffii TaxID=1078050 RepID=UPI0026F24977|nr:hypothetical protein [Seleniivibrio woodruffii]
MIKICGIKDIETAEKCIELGADIIGFVAHRSSKRYIEPEGANIIAAAVRGRVKTCAVGFTLAECDGYNTDFVQANDADNGANHILSGHERPSGEFSYFLFDKSSGRGETCEYPAWVSDYRGKLILAGGLTPENVGDVIRRYRPLGIDVSSGVETDGVKDINKIAEFIKNAKEAYNG